MTGENGALRIEKGALRVVARRLADLGPVVGFGLAVVNLSREVEDAGLGAALVDVGDTYLKGQVTAAEAFGRRPDYFSEDFVEAVRMLEAMGDYDLTLRRWADEELLVFYREVAPHVGRMRGLVEEYPALFNYREGDNPHEG